MAWSFQVDVLQSWIKPLESQASSSRHWRNVLKVFLTVRVMATLVALLSVSSLPSTSKVKASSYIPHFYSNRAFELFLGIWERADSFWYVGIAQNGYQKDPHSVVFMPLYPMLIRGFRFVTHLPEVVAAVLISNFAFFLGLGFFYQLIRTEFDEKVAQRAVWYLALFPGSLFMLAPYSESVFFCLSAAALLAARRDRYWTAGIAGVLVGLTRNLGVVIAAPLLLELWRQRGGVRNREDLKKVTAILLVPLGVFLWFLYLYSKTGDFLAPLHQQSGWSRQREWPWITLFEGLKQAWQFMMAYPGGIYLMEAGAVSGCVILGIVSFFKISLPLTGLLWAYLLPPLIAPFPGRMFMSDIRFVAVIFPAFLTLSVLAKRDTVDQAIRITFASVYGLALSMYICGHYMF